MPVSAGAGEVVAQARKVPVNVVPTSVVPPWATRSSAVSLRTQHAHIRRAGVGGWVPGILAGRGKGRLCGKGRGRLACEGVGRSLSRAGKRDRKGFTWHAPRLTQSFQ